MEEEQRKVGVHEEKEEKVVLANINIPLVALAFLLSDVVAFLVSPCIRSLTLL